MREMFRSLFAMFTSFFRAGETGGRAIEEFASSAENLGKWANNETAFMVERSDMERDQARKEFYALIENKKKAASAEALTLDME